MARSFNGSSDYISASTAFASTPVYSLALWIKANAWSVAYTGLVDLTLTVGGYTRFYVKSTGFVAVYGASNPYIDTSGAYDPWPSSSAISTGAWHHLAFTLDGTTGSTPHKLFIDGVQNGSTMITAGTAANTLTTTIIGQEASFPPRFFDGSIADVAQWNTILTDLEVAALWRGIRPWRIRKSKLIDWWPLDGNQSPEPDLGGLAQNGVLTGTAKAFGPPITMFTPRWSRFEAFAPAGATILMPQACL